MEGELMSQVNMDCPSCQHAFKAEKGGVYECPKCGTSIIPKSSEEDHEKTQIFKV
jgi:predicted RNA-binding Zn-ribbon protein involved in translation (DUF1610 family)